MLRLDIERVTRLREEEGVAHAGQSDGQQPRTRPRIPDHGRHHHQEERELQILEGQPLPEERGAERHREGNDGEAVSQREAPYAAPQGRHLPSVWVAIVSPQRDGDRVVAVDATFVGFGDYPDPTRDSSSLRGCLYIEDFVVSLTAVVRIGGGRVGDVGP